MGQNDAPPFPPPSFLSSIDCHLKVPSRLDLTACLLPHKTARELGILSDVHTGRGGEAHFLGVVVVTFPPFHAVHVFFHRSRMISADVVVIPVEGQLAASDRRLHLRGQGNPLDTFLDAAAHVATLHHAHRAHRHRVPAMVGVKPSMPPWRSSESNTSDLSSGRSSAMSEVLDAARVSVGGAGVGINVPAGSTVNVFAMGGSPQQQPTDGHPLTGSNRWGPGLETVE